MCAGVQLGHNQAQLSGLTHLIFPNGFLGLMDIVIGRTSGLKPHLVHMQLKLQLHAQAFTMSGLGHTVHHNFRDYPKV